MGRKATKAQVVFEFEGSRNLNSSPIDITGLQGDTYDYELVTFFEVEGVGSDVNMTFNNDTGASSYRSYYMQGDGSSAAAAVKDTEPSVSVDVRVYSYPALAIIKIIGDSSTERIVDILATTSVTSGDTRIKKQTNYWKNTVDEINSIQLSKAVSVTSNCRIILYRTPKDSTQEEWELVEELTWTAESTEKSFTGLNGDVDGQYKLVWDGDYFFEARLNGDGTSGNYPYQDLRNNNGTIEALNSTPATYISLLPDSQAIINAESGKERLITLTNSVSSIIAYVIKQSEQGIWWQDTVDNITYIDCKPTSNATGTAQLFRKKTLNKTSDTLPWETVEEVAVNGDFSAGHTFSGLTGDSEFLYKVTFEGTGGTSIRVRFNSDSSTNYTYQLLQGKNSTASALTDTITNISLAPGTDAGESKVGEFLIYPKSGSDRPTIGIDAHDEDTLTYRASWWGDSLNELTSIFAYGASTSTVTGTLRLSKIPRIQP